MIPFNRDSFTSSMFNPQGTREVVSKWYWLSDVIECYLVQSKVNG